MKKYLVFAAAAMLALVGCNKEVEGEGEGGGGNTTPTVFEATFTLDGAISTLEYGEPVILKGTVSEACDAVIFTGVKKDGENYTTVGEDQNAKLENLNATVEFFTDSKEMTDLMVTIKKGKAEAKSYIPVEAVTGEPKGDIWMDDCIVLTAEQKLKPGAGSNVKSFISLHGTPVNGKIEHILSLDEAREANGLNLSFGFVNTYLNDNEKPVAFGNPGYAFQPVGNWASNGRAEDCNGGTEGHKLQGQCESKDAVKFAVYRSDWGHKKQSAAASGYENGANGYRAIDAVFDKILEPKTNLEMLKAWHQIELLEKELDPATTDEQATVSIANAKPNSNIRRIVGGRDAAKKPDSFYEEFRAGDYILVRSQRGTAESPMYYYGIMRVVEFDDAVYQVKDDTGKLIGVDLAKTNDLYGGTITLEGKFQCELSAK